ncbi:hypothetical protein V8C26DRAFT_59999 [Trichoderma gracile]
MSVWGMEEVWAGLDWTGFGCLISRGRDDRMRVDGWWCMRRGFRLLWEGDLLDHPRTECTDDFSGHMGSRRRRRRVLSSRVWDIRGANRIIGPLFFFSCLFATAIGLWARIGEAIGWRCCGKMQGRAFCMARFCFWIWGGLRVWMT